MIKSIVKEVLAREESRGPDQPQQIPVGSEEQTPIRLGSTDSEDEELKRVLASLKTNIKICGCGGAGSNTIIINNRYLLNLAVEGK